MCRRRNCTKTACSASDFCRRSRCCKTTSTSCSWTAALIIDCASWSRRPPTSIRRCPARRRSSEHALPRSPAAPPPARWCCPWSIGPSRRSPPAPAWCGSSSPHSAKGRAVRTTTSNWPICITLFSFRTYRCSRAARKMRRAASSRPSTNSTTATSISWFRLPPHRRRCITASGCSWNTCAPRAGSSRCRPSSTLPVVTGLEIPARLKEARGVAPWHNSRMRTVAEFKIQYRQILDPTGHAVAPLPAFANDADDVLRMYRAMTLARTFDAKAMNLQRTGQLGTYASCLGHEATHVAVGAAMAPEDVLAPVYREVGTQLWRGVTMPEILTYWGGDERGNDFAVPRQDFAWCVPIATQTLHAAGAAMAFKVRKEPRCALAYIGDGGTSEGAFYEALNLAGSRSLPVVFVIVNNGWAISVPTKEQTAAQTLAQKSVAAGIPGVQVDGNDVFAVRETVAEALSAARRGAGPCLIEALTYRLSDHTTADDASRYRSPEEVRQAWELEPLIRLRAFLINAGVWDAEREQRLLRSCAEQVEAEVSAYFTAAQPSTTDAMFDHL